MEYDVVSNGSMDSARARAGQRRPPAAVKRASVGTRSPADERIERIMAGTPRRAWTYPELMVAADATEGVVRAAVRRFRVHGWVTAVTTQSPSAGGKRHVVRWVDDE